MPLSTNTSKGKIPWLCALLVSLAVGGFIGWYGADRRCQAKIVGENNAASLVIVKALTQLREGRTNDALLVLETTLDMNVGYVWRHNPNSDKTTNILAIIKRYRQQYPSFSESLRGDGSSILRERNERANSILAEISASH